MALPSMVDGGAFVSAAAKGSKVTETGVPEEDEDEGSSTPNDITLFMRQVASDNASMVTNYSSWVPQACTVSHI